jgi:hypothetical protein
MNLFLVPPHMLAAYWERVEYGLKIASRKGGIGLFTPEMVQHLLANQQWQLWIIRVFRENTVYAGFLITEYTSDGRGGWLTIHYGYFAKDLGCHTILLSSSRRGYEKIGPPSGFEKGITTWVMTLRDKDEVPPEDH